MKKICDRCGKEMESYMKDFAIGDGYGIQHSRSEVRPWYFAGTHVVCPHCNAVVEKELYHPEEVKAVVCPSNGLVTADHCNKCEHNWSFTGTITGVRCNFS